MMKKTSGELHKHSPEHNRPGIRRIFTLNIGTIIFGILLVYLLVLAIAYALTTHIATYQVTAGPLAQNKTYTGLAVYSEKIVTADSSGYISYYAQDGSTIKSGGAVYGISASRQKTGDVSVDDETLSEIGTDVKEFAGSFDPADFRDAYSLKYLSGGEILNAGLSGTDDADALDIRYGRGICQRRQDYGQHRCNGEPDVQSPSRQYASGRPLRGGLLHSAYGPFPVTVRCRGERLRGDRGGSRPGEQRA